MGKPREFKIERSTEIAAPPEQICALIENFHEWTKWSPWEGIDPNLERTYTGPESGPGSHYAWKGNRKVGEGSMEITAVDPAKRVSIDLNFLKPIKANNVAVFDLTPSESGTKVTWTMTGTQAGLQKIMAKVFPMEKMVGKDFEKGLDQLRESAEGSTT